ncbi:MAG: PDZ domain-containing protein [Anaerolineales bacterium]
MPRKRLRVCPTTQSDQAGLQEQDILTHIDGQTLQGESALAEVVNQHKPGDVLTLTVLRGDQELSIAVTLAERPQ